VHLDAVGPEPALTNTVDVQVTLSEGEAPLVYFSWLKHLRLLEVPQHQLRFLLRQLQKMQVCLWHLCSRPVTHISHLVPNADNILHESVKSKLGLPYLNAVYDRPWPKGKAALICCDL